MGKVKVKTKSKKPASGNAGRPKLIGSKKHRTITHLKYTAKGQRRRHGWK